MNTISFRGGETTGGVADRRIETAKQETTGGVGVRNAQDSIFVTNNQIEQDTVCFRANAEQKSKPSATAITLGSIFTAGLLLGALGLLHKYDAVGKIENEKVKEFFRHTDVVTEPCHKACAWIKNKCYKPVVDYFSNKK